MALFGLVAGIARAAAGAGILRGSVGRLLGGTAKRAARAAVTTTGIATLGGGLIKTLGGGGGPGRSGNGRLTIPGRIRQLLPGVGVDIHGRCPQGFHPAKDGSGKCVRNRSMQVTNARALKRALRRAEGFEKIARRTVSALHHGPRKFKRQRRSS